MARAHAIWAVQSGDTVWRLFTVKHECASWLARLMADGKYLNSPPIEELKVWRYSDNQRDLEDTIMTDVTNEFFDE